MTRYVVALDKTDDLIIEDEHLTLDLTPGWAVFTDPNGTALAIPTEHVRSIQRLDEAGEFSPEAAADQVK